MQTTPQPIYVFDLDGVITNPADSRVDEGVVGAMYQLLADGYCLTVNTGRSFEWVEENLISRLVTERPDDLFRKFIVICEKGGETVRWQAGRWAMQSSQFALPPEVYAKTKEIFDRCAGNLPTMFWDATKRTMATIEKHPQANLDTFHAERQELVEALSNGLQGYQVRIDATTIATDVESMLAGKHAGAELIYHWAKAMTSDEVSYICIGDSVSDYEMARYFADQGVKVTFVYVGRSTDTIDHHAKVAFVATDAQYSAGTREYLGIAIGG